MSKIIILSMIVVSVSAQFVSERRTDERESLNIKSDELRDDQKYEEDGLKTNLRHMHRNAELESDDSFQNFNFAHNDGRLRTNLDTGPIISAISDHNYQPKVEGTYFVEEGAAFRRQDFGQFDVHSNLRSNVGASHLAQDSEERIQSQNSESPQNRENIEPTNNQDVNEQTSTRQIRPNANEQIYRSNKNLQNRNTQEDNNNDRVTDSKQTLRQRHQNIDNNEETHAERNNQHDFIKQNTRETNNQKRSNQNEGHSNSRQSSQNTDDAQYDQNNNQNESNKPNTQLEANQPERRQYSGDHSNNNQKSGTNIDNPLTAHKVSVQNHHNLDTAMDRKISDQITKMIFDQSTLQVTTKSYTKTTKDNELRPPRTGSEKQDDKWIWSDGSEVKNNVTTTAVPTVDDRAAFAGDQCPTGQVRFNNVCTDVD